MLANRRRQIVVAGAAMTLALTACSPSTGGSSAAAGSASAKGKSASLTVTLFGAPWATAVEKGAFAAFTAKTGQKVQTALGDNATWFAQLRASTSGNSPFDVMILTPDQAIQAQNEGLVQPIDTSKLSNWSNVSPSLAKPFMQGGKQYGVPFSAGGLGMVYRKDKIAEPPASWSDMWKPEYSGHVAALPITFQAGAQFFAGLIHEEGGTLNDPAAVNKAFAQLQKLKPSVSATPGNAVAVQTALQQGSAWIAPWWDGRAAALAQTDPNIGFSYPSSGAVAATTTFYLPKNAADPEASYKLLNEMLDPQAQLKFATAMWYPTSNLTTPYSPEFKKLVRADANTFDKYVWVDYKVLTPNLNEWQARWNKIFG